MKFHEDEKPLVPTPVRGPDLTLAGLLARVIPVTRHTEVDTGPTRGREPW